jgi:hypothetical protein
VTGSAPVFSANPTLTTVYATTFDTNVAAAGVTLSGTTLAADGTDSNISISLTPKGTGTVTVTGTAQGGGATDYSAKALKANVSQGTANAITSALGMYDGSVYAGDIGFYYDGTGYAMAFGTNDNTTGNPITALTINRSGNVGIGTTSPDGKLHVMTASAGTVTPDSSADDLTIENSASGGITILTPDASQSLLVFGSPSDAFGAAVRWQNSTSIFELGSDKAGASTVIKSGNGVEAARFDSSSNFLTGGLTAAGTSAAKVLAIGEGTAPSDSPANATQIWSADKASVAGKNTLYMRDEAGNSGPVALASKIIVTHSATESATANQMYGDEHIVTGAYTITLPAAVVGMNAYFTATTAAVFSIDSNGADQFILAGTALTAGNKITSPGGAYDQCQVVCHTANKWTVRNCNAVFTDGGA